MSGSNRTQRMTTKTVVVRATMAIGVAAVMTTAVRFIAQDARSASRTDAHGPRASITSGMFGNGNGLEGQGTEKYSVEIVIPDGTSGEKRFAGEIGSRDEADFRSQDGSNEVMRVTSLDDDLGALIAVRVQGPEQVVGTAYSFRRQEDGGLVARRSGQFSLKWSARGMDSAVAIDVDTYLELHGGSISQAIRASLRRAGQSHDYAIQN